MVDRTTVYSVYLMLGGHKPTQLGALGAGTWRIEPRGAHRSSAVVAGVVTRNWNYLTGIWNINEHQTDELDCATHLEYLDDLATSR